MHHGSLLPVVAFGPGHVPDQVGQRPLLVADALELGGFCGSQLCLAALDLIELCGPIVDLLLQRFKHLELSGRRDAVAASPIAGAPTAAPPTATLSAAGGIGLERFD